MQPLHIAVVVRLDAYRTALRQIPAILLQQRNRLIQALLKGNAAVVHPCAAGKGRVRPVHHAHVHVACDLIRIHQITNRLAHILRQLPGGIIHLQGFQLTGAIVQRQRCGARLMLGCGNGAGEDRVHPGVFVTLNATRADWPSDRDNLLRKRTGSHKAPCRADCHR